jgi:hypothetical protein
LISLEGSGRLGGLTADVPRFLPQPCSGAHLARRPRTAEELAGVAGAGVDRVPPALVVPAPAGGDGGLGAVWRGGRHRRRTRSDGSGPARLTRPRHSPALIRPYSRPPTGGLPAQVRASRRPRPAEARPPSCDRGPHLAALGCRGWWRFQAPTLCSRLTRRVIASSCT